ncbi:hypothetical protein SAMN04490206_3078 [Pseudomonas umsongensis]|nr:hypothetical protein SAMN04490206_3078 [Pseudomonas umsongensis]
MGHPWPSAAKPASMPVYPLHRTSTRPLEGARKSKAKSKATAKARRPDSRPDGRSVRDPIVGASLLAMDFQAARSSRQGGLSLTSIASRLAPTGVRAHLKSGRLSGRLALAFDLGAPLTTMAERRHCAVGKPAGRRFSRAGPGMAHRGDPGSNAGERACRATARHRVVGQSLLLPFWRLKKGVAVRAKP